MKTKLAVFMAKNKYEDVCDYTVQASWFARSCEVYVGDASTKLAQVCISRASKFWNDIWLNNLVLIDIYGLI